jgi:hypothetical protein
MLGAWVFLFGFTISAWSEGFTEKEWVVLSHNSPAWNSWDFTFHETEKTGKLYRPLIIPWFYPVAKNGLFAFNEFRKKPIEELLSFYEENSPEADSIMEAMLNNQRMRTGRINGNDAQWAGSCDAAAFFAAHFYVKDNPNRRLKMRAAEAVMVAYELNRERNIRFYFFGSRSWSEDRGLHSFKDYSVSNGEISEEDFYNLRAKERDFNAGLFFISLVNGLRDGKPVIYELDPGERIIHGVPESYEWTELKAQPGDLGRTAPGTVRQVLIEMKVRVANFHVKPGVLQTLSLKFWLELDANDRVIGGRWVSRTRPDFAWRANDDLKVFLNRLPDSLRNILEVR